MIDNPVSQWTTGNLENPARTPMPVVEIDCSNWESEIPEDQWSRGQLESICQSVPFPSEPADSASPGLLITLAIDPASISSQSVLIATRLISEIHSAHPDLGLTYDLRRSRAENGTIRIALTSTKGERVEQRLLDIANSIPHDRTFHGLMVKTVEVSADE